MKQVMKQVELAAEVLAALQASEQTPQPESQGGEERTLRPVVVTPTPGVAQDAFDTPASVDVIQGEQLRNARLQVNLSEPLVRVPGVVALNSQNYAQDLQISIRGFGARSTFGVRGLRLYADGIPVTAPDGQGQVSHFDLATADRLEVLRGPFSALYGNSSGGVISLFTADGGPREVLEAATTVSCDGVRRQNVRFSGDEGDWNWNLGATHFETDGLRDHSAAKRNAINGKLRLKASADTRLTLVLNAVDMPDVQDPLGLTRAEYEANPIGAQTPATQPDGVISLKRDFQGIDAQWIARTRAFDRPLTFTAGVMADELKEDRKGYRNCTGPVAAPTALGVLGELRRDERNRVRSFDQYAQAQWQSEFVSLTAGLRHSELRFDSRDQFIVGANGDDSGSARYEVTTPVLGATWHVNEHLNLYAAAGRGFETPIFNELSYRPGGVPGLNFGLGPAKSRQYELGVKAEPARDWRVNAALFQADTSDEIAVLSNAGGRSTFQNVGKSRRRGFEASLDGKWGKGCSAHTALTYLDATYQSSFLTCVASPCAVPNTLVAAGNRIPGIPRLTAYAEVAWRHRPWGLEMAVEAKHAGSIPVDDRNTDHAPAATVFNLRVSPQQQRDRWTFREFLRVDNLADRGYVGSVIVNEGNRRFFEPAPGRTWLLGVSAAYAF